MRKKQRLAETTKRRRKQDFIRNILPEEDCATSRFADCCCCQSRYHVTSHHRLFIRWHRCKKDHPCPHFHFFTGFHPICIFLSCPHTGRIRHPRLLARTDRRQAETRNSHEHDDGHRCFLCSDDAEALTSLKNDSLIPVADMAFTTLPALLDHIARVVAVGSATDSITVAGVAPSQFPAVDQALQACSQKVRLFYLAEDELC